MVAGRKIDVETAINRDFQLSTSAWPPIQSVLVFSQIYGCDKEIVQRLQNPKSYNDLKCRSCQLGDTTHTFGRIRELYVGSRHLSIDCRSSLLLLGSESRCNREVVDCLLLSCSMRTSVYICADREYKIWKQHRNTYTGIRGN